MKLNPSSADPVRNIQDVSPAPSSDQEKTLKTSAAPGAPEPVEPNLHLSALSTQVRQLREKFGVDADVDRDKIEAIKTAIREGRLQIDAKAISEKMLADLLGSGSEENRG